MKKGGLYCLSTTELTYAKCAELQWQLTPAMLAAFSTRRSSLELK
jgi:hypothetical protein